MSGAFGDTLTPRLGERIAALHGKAASLQEDVCHCRAWVRS